MLPDDSLAAAEAKRVQFDDARVSHAWDADRAAANAWAAHLGLTCPAWDVYVFYSPDTTWDGDPPEAAFWMHQLPSSVGAHPACLLDPHTLARRWLELLGRETATAGDLALRLHAAGVACAAR